MLTCTFCGVTDPTVSFDPDWDAECCDKCSDELNGKEDNDDAG